MAKTTKKKLGSRTPLKKGKTRLPKYRLEVLVNDTDYKGSGDSLAEALTDFVESGDFPFGVKTRVVLRYKKGNVERHRMMHVPEARKVFSIISSKPSALELFATKLEEELA